METSKSRWAFLWMAKVMRNNNEIYGERYKLIFYFLEIILNVHLTNSCFSPANIILYQYQCKESTLIGKHEMNFFFFHFCNLKHGLLHLFSFPDVEATHYSMCTRDTLNLCYPTVEILICLKKLIKKNIYTYNWMYSFSCSCPMVVISYLE